MSTDSKAGSGGSTAKTEPTDTTATPQVIKTGVIKAELPHFDGRGGRSGSSDGTHVW